MKMILEGPGSIPVGGKLACIQTDLYIFTYKQAYHRIWVNQPPFSSSWNILDMSVLTHTQSLVILYVVGGPK